MQSQFKIGLIKLRAKKLKREKGITHTQALNEVIKVYGFRDWQHFINEITGVKESDKTNT